MSRPSHLFTVQLEPELYRALQDLARICNLAKGNIAKRALLMYFKHCGHDPGQVESLIRSQRAEQELKALTVKTEELERQRQAAVREAETLREKMAVLKEKSDEKVRRTVHQEAMKALSGDERARVPGWLKAVAKPGPFGQVVRDLADAEARGVPAPMGALVSDAHLTLLRIFKTWQGVAEAAANTQLVVA